MEGEGGVRGAGGGGVPAFIENPRRGGVSQERGGAGSVSGIWGGAKYFFSGSKFPPSFDAKNIVKLG